MLTSTAIPNIAIINEEATQLRLLKINVRNRLIPSIKEIQKNNLKTIEIIYSTIDGLIDYLSKPKLGSLVSLNSFFESLPESVGKKGLFNRIEDAVLKRSNLRHVFVLSGVAVISIFVSYVDINYLAATAQGAFTLGVGSFIGIAAIYVTYLGLTVRR